VINIFEQLLAAAPQSDLADQFHYELAWAYKYSDQPKQAIEHFQHIAQNLQESPRAAEANFHLAQDAYVRQDFPQAARGFQIAADMSKDPSIREKAMYKLAWSHFKLKDFEQALTGFRRQIESFPAGSPLYADAVFMVSESLFETNKFPEALQQYRVAKPIIETSETVSDNLKILTYLHGAQSANLAKEHQEAINFAQALLQEQNAKNVQPHVRQEAEMELGDAYRALNQPDKALQAYEQAARHPGRAGARSMCMAGEILFDQKTFGEAVNKFKLVLYGYGGLESATDVKPWQALAAYEAGRCVLVQIADASDAAAKNQLIAESKKHFDYVINNFPEDDLAPKARSERAKLDNIR
jgi:tetratricopeptide (TPR) repeat protein